MTTVKHAECTARYHGHYWTVARGCCCPQALDAYRDYRRARRRGQQLVIDATGTRRRVQALAAMGYGAEHIAQISGVSERTIRQMYTSQSSRITARKATAINATYNRLRHTPGPSQLARARARNRGWPDPAYWEAWGDIDTPEPPPDPDLVDEVAVERAIHGDTAVVDRLADAERLAVAQQLLAAGASGGEIRRCSGLPERMVRALWRAHHNPEQSLLPPRERAAGRGAPSHSTAQRDGQTAAKPGTTRSAVAA
jgi:hypothetical protein